MLVECQENSPLLKFNQENFISFNENDIRIEEKIEREKLFDRYVVTNAEELQKLQEKDRLKGSFIFTYDSDHVGIHKGFYFVQKVVEKIKSWFKNSKNVDLNICHAMIAVGWNTDKGGRPELAHSVMDGVKVNRVDYFKPIQFFCKAYKTANKLFVYVPKSESFRHEFAYNALSSAKISSEKINRSRFSWSNLMGSPFKKQTHKTPTELMQKELAYVTADILLQRKISLVSNEKKARKLFCTEYAVSVLQASVLTGALSEEEKYKFIEEFPSRKALAQEIFRRIKTKDDSDVLSKAYWNSRVCRKMDPKKTVSPYASYLFDKESHLKNLKDDD